jgi:uncharacterized DUF497 family protein
VVISGFEWDDDNVEHIQRHGFTPEEVEEVFAGAYKVRRARQSRYVAFGGRSWFFAAWGRAWCE